MGNRRIQEQIERRRQKVVGTVLNGPYLATIGAYQKWVADVVIQHDQQILYKVIISDYNMNRKYASAGMPVEIRTDKAGILSITGKAEILKNTVVKNRYKPDSTWSKFFGFTPSGDDFETPGGNVITGEDDSEATYTWQNRIYTYAEISPYGSLPYGYSVMERV